MTRRRKQKRTLPVGSISHGTLKSEDLIDAFTSALDDIQLSREERKIVTRIERERERKFETPPEELDNMLDDLFIIMEDKAPEYCHFGNTEGDGSDFGVWIDWESIEEDEKTKYLGRGDQLPSPIRDGGPAHFLVVNDHGNAMLYRYTGNRWYEVWSVV